LLNTPKRASREVRETKSVVALTRNETVVMEYTESSVKVTLTSTAEVAGKKKVLAEGSAKLLALTKALEVARPLRR